jgi:anthranilate synthase/phosphoribosyltransferase
MILLIDNYDSFSYNLYQLAGSIEPDIKVVRNDAMTIQAIKELAPEAIILSPGPGHPEDAGICMDVVRELVGKIPILGVCLGHQAICAAYGATVSYAAKLMHGKQSDAELDQNSLLFAGCGESIKVARYHSLAVIKETLPKTLRVTAETYDGEVMAVEDTANKVYGLQFHPESIMTPEGNKILRNFMNIAKGVTGSVPAADKGGVKMIQQAIVKIVDKQDLTYDEAYAVMNEIMSGETSQVQNAAFLAALSTKSTKAETIDEISGCAAAMRNHAIRVDHPCHAMEIVGTGGDGAHSFNISTVSALVVSAAGVKIAKHGNRAASSLCGTADCLEALGVNISQAPEKCAELLDDTGICFLFAQKYHTSMKYVGAIRKELGIRTVFNILGPLTNPASPEMQLLGVYDGSLIEPLARVLTSLGVKRGMVVYGQDKLDEISLSADTSVCEFADGKYKSYVIDPEKLGFKKCSKADIAGGDPKENAETVHRILAGEKGPKRDIVLLNAGAALYIAQKAASLEEGINLAAETIDSGAAAAKLDAFIKASNE